MSFNTFPTKPFIKYLYSAIAMCGIIGIFHDKEAKSKVEQALKIMENRGKDGSKIKEIIDSEKCFLGFLGHTLHAIVDRVSQPLTGKGTLAANCEIYNWKELGEKYHLSSAKNDAELLLQFLDTFGVTEATLNELDGMYAFTYLREGVLYLARDLLGEKPLWFSEANIGDKKSFAFSSEKKVLENLGCLHAEELNPRHILKYTLTKKEFNTEKRTFFSCFPEHQESKEIIKDKTTKLLEKAVEKRIPQKKFGLLFSGGIDSTFLAKIIKDKVLQNQSDTFTCYTAVLDVPGVQASDLSFAQEAAKTLGVPLKVRKIKMEEIPEQLKKIVPLIEDSNVTKVGVALTFSFACELAKEDGCKVIFSGLGSEEIFAGYERHKNSANINQECVSGLLKMYERDLYRDDVITMHYGLELRLPFLDKELISYALKIPAKYKIKNKEMKKMSAGEITFSETITKLLLREIALEQGVPEKFALRRKTAAQYGSRMDYALDKLAKRNGFSSKSAYLKTFYPQSNLRLGILFSSGKDSATAAHIMQQQNYELSCLITLKSKNKDSFMFQEAGTELVELQAQAMEIPLVVQETAGEKEKELKDLEIALRKAKELYHLDGIVTGALASTYQRDRIEAIADSVGLKIFSPLWHKSQENHLKELLSYGFEAVITKIAADGLDESWLGRRIDLAAVEALEKLHQKNNLQIAGEGGEFETFVLNGPLFKKRINLLKIKKEMDMVCSGRLIIGEAELAEKLITIKSKKQATKQTIKQTDITKIIYE